MCCSISIDKISKTLDIGILKKELQTFGPLKHFYESNKQGRSATIEFVTPDAAHLAILELNGTTTYGSPVEVSSTEHILSGSHDIAGSLCCDSQCRRG